jgi:hypothetical protein
MSFERSKLTILAPRLAVGAIAVFLYQTRMDTATTVDVANFWTDLGDLDYEIGDIIIVQDFSTSRDGVMTAHRITEATGAVSTAKFANLANYQGRELLESVRLLWPLMSAAAVPVANVTGFAAAVEDAVAAKTQIAALSGASTAAQIVTALQA